MKKFCFSKGRLLKKFTKGNFFANFFLVRKTIFKLMTCKRFYML
ncbi:hypothetical protein FM106_19765 [Brachybacterium faecium]|nr:hypothetical protein FM106_19765 [Brachybacterium faecium]